MIATEQKPRTEQAIVAEQKKEIKFLGTARKVPGHIMFEINLTTKEIKPATYKEAIIEATGKQRREKTTRLKLIMNDECVYVQALNKKNALRKLGKRWTDNDSK